MDVMTRVGEAYVLYKTVHGLDYLARVVLKRGERSAAILMHYQHRASGKGHASDSVLGCREDKCAVFAA